MDVLWESLVGNNGTDRYYLYINGVLAGVITTQKDGSCLGKATYRGQCATFHGVSLEEAKQLLLLRVKEQIKNVIHQASLDAHAIDRLLYKGWV